MRDVLVGIIDREPDLRVVASVPDGVEALVAARRVRPDVVVMDVSMPGVDGILATRALRQEHPACQVLMLSASYTGRVVREALDAGACGFLLKHGSPEALVEGIRSAGRGGRPFAPLARMLLDS